MFEVTTSIIFRMIIQLMSFNQYSLTCLISQNLIFLTHIKIFRDFLHNFQAL